MMYVSTLTMRSVLAPAARKQRADTSEERNPKDDAPKKLQRHGESEI